MIGDTTCSRGHPRAQFWIAKASRCRKCESDGTKARRAGKPRAPRSECAHGHSRATYWNADTSTCRKCDTYRKLRARGRLLPAVAGPEQIRPWVGLRFVALYGLPDYPPPERKMPDEQRMARSSFLTGTTRYNPLTHFDV